MEKIARIKKSKTVDPKKKVHNPAIGDKFFVMPDEQNMEECERYFHDIQKYLTDNMRIFFKKYIQKHPNIKRVAI